MSNKGGQVVGVLVLLLLGITVLTLAASDYDSDYFDLDADVGTLQSEDPDVAAAEDQTVHARWKREASQGGSWKLPSSNMLKKARKLAETMNLSPNLKQAIEEGDFSKVSPKDVEEANITILECIPTKVFEKVNITVLTAFIDKFLWNNRPSAIGRLVQSSINRLDATYLLDKITSNQGIRDTNLEAANVLLYFAISKLPDRGLTNDMVNRLTRDGLLEHVSEGQLLAKIKEVAAAKSVLRNLGQALQKPERRGVDNNKALISELIELGNGPIKDWSTDGLKLVDTNVNAIPAASLKLLKPEVVTWSSAIKQLSETKFDSPLQSKTIADIYMAQKKILAHTNRDGYGNPQQLETESRQMQNLVAFMPPGITKDMNLLHKIIASCEKLNITAPVRAIVGFYEGRKRANNKIHGVSTIDFQNIPATILKNSPPEFLKAATTGQNTITRATLEEIASSTGISKQGKTQRSYYPGTTSQLAAYALQTFSSRGNVEFNKIPGAYAGALGVKEINKISGNDIEVLITNLRDNPDALDDGQKSLLLKKLLDKRGQNDIGLAPEFVVLMPRKKKEMVKLDILNGLSADSEYRLAFASTKHVNLYELKKNPQLVGTLTPKQVESLGIDDIPLVLNLVRKTRDGPQSQALKALYLQLVKYIREKTEGDESDPKKLLKYLTAAEITKIPGSVLAYFIDAKEIRKLSDPVKKEIMIAIGKLSPKDYAFIPRKTREEIISQGLEVMEKTLGKETNYTGVQLALLGVGVVDLPPNKIQRLSPGATELALDIVNGISEDGLKQRACLKPEQRRAWRDKLVSLYGLPGTWDPSNVTALCCSLDLLTEDDLVTVHKDGISTCKCLSDVAPRSHLADLKKSLDANCQHDIGGRAFYSSRNLFNKIKAERTLDYEDMESQVFSNSRRSRDSPNEPHKRTLNCYALRLQGSAAGYDTKILETLPPKDINNCLYELGVERLSHDNARILWQKLIKANHDSIERIPAESLRLANNVLNGIVDAEVSKLNLSDPDVVAAFSRPLGLHKNTLKKIAENLKFVNYGVESYLHRDIVIVRNILCGFDKDKLAMINANVFREVLPILRNLEGTCGQTKLAALAAIVVKPQVFGDTSNWGPEDVRAIGILLKGLAQVELKKIPAEAFLGVTPTVAQALNGDTLKELSPEQLSFIPAFSAQALSSEQINSLSSQGKEKLEGVIRGPLLTGHSPTLRNIPFWTATLVFTTLYLTTTNIL